MDCVVKTSHGLSGDPDTDPESAVQIFATGSSRLGLSSFSCQSISHFFHFETSQLHWPPNYAGTSFQSGLVCGYNDLDFILHTPVGRDLGAHLSLKKKHPGIGVLYPIGSSLDN